MRIKSVFIISILVGYIMVAFGIFTYLKADHYVMPDEWRTFDAPITTMCTKVSKGDFVTNMLVNNKLIETLLGDEEVGSAGDFLIFENINNGKRSGWWVPKDYDVACLMVLAEPTKKGSPL